MIFALVYGVSAIACAMASCSICSNDAQKQHGDLPVSALCLDFRVFMEDSVEIAGGLYKELCFVPNWDHTFGSGGRAAAAVSKISPGSRLHTYAGPSTAKAITYFNNLGIDVRAHLDGTSIAFAYFHPLSPPHIEPPIKDIVRQPPILVSGKSVLRFGFIEGEAIVRAERAVYDPQSHVPAEFSTNGSLADELAIVLNEGELYALSGRSSIADGVAQLMQDAHVLVVVVKRGTQGAEVYERGKEPSRVPAYRSTKVFKIGTGDVFSAIFAHHWSEKLLSPHEAANVASKSVAAYASSKSLPVSNSWAEKFAAIGSGLPKPIQLVGSTSGIGRRYVMEEARFRLRELGAAVQSEAFDHAESLNSPRPPGAIFAISEGLSPELQAQILQAHSVRLPIVILAEHGVDPKFEGLSSSKFIITDDFCSALYLAAWSAIPDGEKISVLNGDYDANLGDTSLNSKLS